MNLFFPNPSTSLENTSQTGNWLLETGRAITVTSRRGGQLRVARGRVWATLGANNTAAWRSVPLEPCAMLEDYFLSAGDMLSVPPGAKVVIESMEQTEAAPVAFSWGHAPQPVSASRTELAQASSELGFALGQAVRALRRLVAAVLVGQKPVPQLGSCP